MNLHQPCRFGWSDAIADKRHDEKRSCLGASAHGWNIAFRNCGAMPHVKVSSTTTPESTMRMNDPTQSPEAASWIAAILYKLLPGGLGALVMVCVDPPESKRELFARLFVAFACSYFLGDVVFDGLRSFNLFAFLDSAKRAHTVAVDFIVGGVGWFLIGGAAMLLKKWKADPQAAIDTAKRV